MSLLQDRYKGWKPGSGRAPLITEVLDFMRVQHDITRETVARHLGLCPPAISHCMNRGNLSWEHLVLWAEVLRRPVSEIVLYYEMACLREERRKRESSIPAP